MKCLQVESLLHIQTMSPTTGIKYMPEIFVSFLINISKSLTFFHSTIAWYKQKRLFIMHLFWCCYCIWIISNHYTLLSLKNNMNNIAFSCNSSGIHKSVKFFFWDEMLLVASLRNLKEKGNMDFVQTLRSASSSHIPSGVSVYSFKREI